MKDAIEIACWSALVLAVIGQAKRAPEPPAPEAVRAEQPPAPAEKPQPVKPAPALADPRVQPEKPPIEKPTTRIAWQKNYATAKRLAGEMDRPALLIFSVHDNTCPGCIKVWNLFETDNGLCGRVFSQFAPTWIDPRKQPQLAKDFNVTKWPTAVVYWPETDRAVKFSAPHNAADFHEALDEAVGR